jgi:acyl-CoA synthetase (AMP-forming)/AMP-acid ligase II
MTHAHTIAQLLKAGDDAAPAIQAPGRTPLSHGALRALYVALVRQLGARGLGRRDRVAIVLPNGPEMATAFLGVAGAAEAAPLNPAYRDEEFAFYLSDLRAKALIVERGSESPSRAVARRLGIPVLEIAWTETDPAGAFRFVDEAPEAGAGPDPAPEDVALVLHTSGTTSRPKLVPLSHLNVTASARHIGETLRLGADDVCLNIMPLFHIHGLMAGVLSPLSAGGSVSCTPGFNALKMFAWLDEVRPTWYTAVPTMHQAILARAERNPESVGRAALRLIRSSSASLPPQVMAALEETFRCPVIESYGMTEAAHQMASNPLPPGVRKPGTVGPAAGPRVAIMDPDGHMLPAGEIGEVVISGPNVTAGYADNPKANAEAFINGWFRTGDQGVLDADGYLTITGRLKELINRGGEKISPREVDEVLMDHPAVLQVVTFAVPHRSLGEDVAAVVVLREGAEADEAELRRFAADRLADFKVPRKILFLQEIPKGATGKLQRIGLAEKLGLAS